MGNRSDGLIVSHSWHQATVYDFENAASGLDGSVSALVENAPHVTVTLGERWFLDTLAVFRSRACTHPGSELLVRSKGGCRGTDFGKG